MRTDRLWNTDWQFQKLPNQTMEQLAHYHPEHPLDITLPHTWYEDGLYYQGNALYLKRFQLNRQPTERAYVRFEAVEKVCRIFLNGHLIGEHKGGYSSFCCALDPYLVEDGMNELRVIVNNEKGDTVSPLSGDFALFGGITRDVHLLLLDENHFSCSYYGTDGVIVKPYVDGEYGVLQIHPYIDGSRSHETRMTCLLRDEDGVVVAQQTAISSEPFQLRLKAPVFWNGTKKPYLYHLTALLTLDGMEIDRVEMNTGFRSIAIDPDHGFFLNGAHLKLNGVAKHQDTDKVFAAATETHWRNDLTLIHEIGANAIRLSHYQHPQRVYDLCDEMGLIVWTEIPMLKMLFRNDLLENAAEQLKELIYQNLHHPSICFWGIQNEIAIFGESPEMYREVEKLHQLVTELDDTRLSTSANLNTVALDSPLNHITDTVAYNLYFGWYYGEFEDFETFIHEFHQKNPLIPLGISEYGADCNLTYHSEVPKRKDYSEEFQAQFHEKTYPIIQKHDFIWGSFVWNMFDFVSPIRDEGGMKYRNTKGLVTYDRTTKKDAFYYYKAQWSTVPFVHIAEKRFEQRCRNTMDVKIYSNCRTVTLQTAHHLMTLESETGVFVFHDIRLKKGINRMLASAGDQMDVAIFELVSEPVEAYRFVDPNPGPNVKNWYEDEQEKERLFPTGFYSVMDTINDLLKNESVMHLIDEQFHIVGQHMRDTIGTFTLEQLCAYEKTLVTEEQLQLLNKTITTIKKS